MRTLLKGSTENKWYPQSIETYKSSIRIPANTPEYRRFRSNFAYSMQYIEYLEKQLAELRLSDVLTLMTIKSYILTGMSVIELVFTYIIKANNQWSSTNWKKSLVVTTNQNQFEGRDIKIETTIYTRVAEYPEQMTLDSMMKKVESHSLLTVAHDVYPICKHLRQLRNRVHLQEGSCSTDHDYNSFSFEKLQVMRKVLYMILTSPEICNCNSTFQFLIDSYNNCQNH